MKIKLSKHARLGLYFLTFVLISTVAMYVTAHFFSSSNILGRWSFVPFLVIGLLNVLLLAGASISSVLGVITNKPLDKGSIVILTLSVVPFLFVCYVLATLRLVP